MVAPDIHIRPLKHDDDSALVESVRESIDQLLPWMPWCHRDYGISEARDWVEKENRRIRRGKCLSLRDHMRSVSVCWGVRLDWNQPRKSNGESGVLGPDIFYRSGHRLTGNPALVDWAFENTALNRLEILVAIRNHSSLRVAAKAGAVWEGVLRGRLRLHDEPHDAVLFSVVRADR